MNNSHQQLSNENMKTSVKTQRTHLKSKRNERVHQLSAKQKLEEDEG